MATNGKKALTGFADLRYFPVTVDNSTTYTPGAGVQIVGAQTCTQSDNRQDYQTYADDGVYDQGSDYQYTELQITVAQMLLADLAALTGAALETETQVLSETSVDDAPEVALSFSGRRRDGGKRLFRYLNAKLTAYKADLNTKGNQNSVASYTLTFRCSGRAADQVVRQIKDADVATGGTLDISWLQTIDAIPKV